MHLPPLALSLALLTTGCSAAKTAMSALSPKPAQVTVVNNVEPATVAVTTPSPSPVAVVVVEKTKPRGLMEQVGIVTTSTATGALLGGVIGHVTGHARGPSAIIGASVGAAAGVVMTKL
ncbi:MAG: hypothetical protein H0T89_16705 [Deltaproteobacteria bacterium]|nr:hypothetical protein [Deltaproteobacteria bacterium]MDQ3297566.1 hypothetical protein [Myxococcota bacterium]